ncbi:MAG: ATP-binding protein, partial [Myxococcota bacterium]
AERIEYDLQNARILLGVAVDVYAGSRSAVQPIGEDPTADLQNRPAHARIAALRQELETDIPRIRRLEQEVGQKQIEGFIRSVRTLNQLRLDLRPFLPDEQRKPLSGFGAIGREQAERELVQVGVVLRYHGLIVVRWAERLSKGDGWRGLSMGPVAAVLFALLVYWWWTRRADRVLDAWRRREEEEARLRTAAGGERGIQVAALRFLQRIRRPLEWLLLFLGIQLALPRSVAELDEVKLVGLALWWMVGEAFAVDTVHALLSWSRRRGVDPDESELQLRGLRFVGRSVVVFGLGLSLTDQLVGRGTIYDWIVFAAAVAAIPILSVVIRWYQAEIHRRLDELGRKPALIEWAASQDRGLSSFVAAFVGAGFLVGRGSYRLFRRYLGGFDWTRRLLAYWFRRGLTKQEQKSSDFGPSELRPLEDDRRHALDPELPPTEIVPSIADPQVVEVIQRVREPGGGVFAVVGERGAGKSTLLRRIRSQSKATLIHCPHRLDGLVAEIAACMDMPASCSLAELGVAVADAGDDEAILIDDAHHLIRPVIGGLRDFERVLAMARDSSLGGCTWVLGMDRVIWQYFERARGARPLLDDVIKLKPWTEEGIARLLRQRSTTIGLQPEFTKMVQGLRPDADEFDRREALERAESNYYRLIWDYALGNPGVALHFWRDSLAVNAKGGVEVRLFSPPDTGDIESLPDEAVFVLRAVVQLESATVDDIV